MRFNDKGWDNKTRRMHGYGSSTSAMGCVVGDRDSGDGKGTTGSVNRRRR